jgi:hypothetical protein
MITPADASFIDKNNPEAPPCSKPVFDAGEALFIVSIQKGMLNSLFRTEQGVF